MRNIGTKIAVTWVGKMLSLNEDIRTYCEGGVLLDSPPKYGEEIILVTLILSPQGGEEYLGCHVRLVLKSSELSSQTTGFAPCSCVGDQGGGRVGYNK